MGPLPKCCVYLEAKFYFDNNFVIVIVEYECDYRPAEISGIKGWVGT